MSKQHWEAQLTAGGMVLATAKVDEGATEKVVARRYVGPALGNRVVVRLGADRLGPAEDLAMEFLGLVSDGESKPIAQQSRRALGFASWALITHPENAKYALSLVKRIKSAARKAKSKPGHAYDQFTEMAGELNRSVRHFLPPFWEEAARIFKDLGNATYAGRAFGKALEAERVHALDVDPLRRRDAVLEFTLSGCLSGKALTEYTKDIEKQFEPNEAFDTLRDLLVRRTMGGMPPVPTAAKDLGRFAKAAGKDPDAEIESLLETIIASPAMSRAPNQFWKSVSKQVAKLVARHPAFGVWLLVHTDPQSSWSADSPVWAWLDLLEQWKVLPLLAEPAKELPPGVEIPGGRAGWISRLIGVETAPKKRVFELLELAADAIREEGQPIQFDQGGYGGGIVDVDVLEYCLELGLEVADLLGLRQLDFSGWLMKDVDHPRRNSQLTRLIADDRFAGKVFAEIPELVTFMGSGRGNSSYGRTEPPMRAFESAAQGHDAICDVWWQFVDAQIKQLENGGLRDLEIAMEVICRCFGRATVEQFPEVLPRLQKVDMPRVLQRTLAAGVIDEYGWPALDEADDEEPLPRFLHRKSKVLVSFPWLTVLREGKVETIGPAGRRLMGEFVLSKNEDLQLVLPVIDDVMLVYLDTSAGYDQWIKWLSDPNQASKFDEYLYGFDVSSMIEIDGGVFYGAGMVCPGDTKIPRPAFWLCDGERFWTTDNEYRMWNEFDSDGQQSKPAGLQEIDPNTGKKIRASIPAWFEQLLPAEGTILWNTCGLMPAPSGTEASPLGVKDGMIGWRVVRRRDESHESLGIDGRSHVAVPDSPFATAIVDQPGCESHWIVDSENELIEASSGRRIASVDPKMEKYRAGQASPLPIPFWHFFKVRCPASSRKLRATELSEARKLFEAAKLEHEALKVKADEKKPAPNRKAGATAVSNWMPEAPPRLVKGISRIARIAAAEQISLDKLIQKLTQTAEASAAPTDKGKSGTGASQKEIEEGLNELLYPLEGCETQFTRGGDESVSPKQILQVIEFFKSGETDELAQGSYFFSLIDDLSTAAWTTFWIHAHRNADDGVPVQERLQGPWLEGLTFLTESGVYDLPGNMTVFVASEPDEATGKKLKAKNRLPAVKKPVAFVEGKVRYVAFSVSSVDAKAILALNAKMVILAYVEKGQPKPPTVFNIEESISLRKRWMSTSVRSFVNAVKQVKTLPLIDAAQLQLAAEKLKMSPIQVALGWMGNFRTLHHGQDKLTKELRTHYGWKVGDIKTAIAALDANRPLLSALSEGARLDPSGCLGERLDRGFDRTINAWLASRKEIVPIPPEVIDKLRNVQPGYGQMDMKTVNQLLVDPSSSPTLGNSEVSFEYNRESHAYQALSQKFTPERSFNEDKIYPYLMNAICLLNYELPFADPVRRKLPGLLEAIRVFLDHKTNTLPFGMQSTLSGGWSENPVDKDPVLEKFSGLVGKCTEGKDGLFRIDNGLIVGAIYPPAVTLRFRTSKLKSQKEFDALLAAASITFNYESDGSTALQQAYFTLCAHGTDVDSLIENNRSEVIPAGDWDQDPRVSAPVLVQKVAKKLKVSEEGATLYLQVLALHDPTNVRVKQWNGWSSKVLNAASEELLSAEQLVSAKRSRAGRNHFLPGGWEALKLPNLPLESWKLSMFGYQNTDALRGGYANLIVCPRPVADQFQLAWNRVLSGDAPKYEEAIM